MFDFRYHAVSLVAVFIALAVGLLLGVAIGDRGLVSSAEKDLRASLRGEVRSAQRRAAELETQLGAARGVDTKQLYPVAVADRLKDKRIGIVGIGGTVPKSIKQHVIDALEGSGGRLVSVPVLREPLDIEAVARAARGTRYAQVGSRPELVGRLGQRVGSQLARGGDLIQRLRPALFTDDSTGPLDGLDGVVIYKADRALTGVPAQTVKAFETGLFASLKARKVPAVGVEELATAPSQVSWYGGHQLASVDDIDQLVGRLATVLVLAGESSTEPEPYGQKSTAQQGTPLTP